MADGIKVLMMGGQRVGKSSALAAVMEAFINGAEKAIFTAKDTTSLATINGERQASLSSKLESVKELLNDHIGKTIISNSGKTNVKWDYNIELTLTGTNDSMVITFTDVNGEFFEGGNIHQEEIIELVKTYDVFIVAIDTPFLMESRNENSDLVDKIINTKYNCTESIHTFLTQIDDKDGNDAKLVIFVPIKCEYWARNNQFEDVSNAVLEDYDISLKYLRKCKSVQIEVLPVQTIGSVFFAEHREAYICDWTEKRFFFFNKSLSSKCALLPNGCIRLSNGDIKKKTESMNIYEDIDAVLIPGTDIVRPNAWYSVESAEYRPHNCEQLALHIMEFMLAKVIDAKIKEEERQNAIVRGFFHVANFVLNFSTLGLWNKLCNLFGGISLEMMQKSMTSIKDKNLLKRSGEGITIVKECKFRTK